MILENLKERGFYLQRIINSNACKDIGPLKDVDISLDKVRQKFIIRNKLRNYSGKKRLGILWLIMDPVAYSLVYLFVLTVVRSNPNFESLFIGISMYRMFQGSFMSGVGSIDKFSGGIICERVRSRVLVSAAIKYRFLETIIQSSGISIILFFFLEVNILSVMSFISLSLLIGVLAEGVGLNMSKLVRRIPDIRNLVNYFMLVMFFGSPVLYPLARTSGLHYRINEFNPFTYFVETVRFIADLESSLTDFSIGITLSLSIIVIFLSLRGYLQIDRLRWDVSSWS